MGARILRSLGRITLAAVAAAAAIFVVVAAVLRQPTFGNSPLRLATHADANNLRRHVQYLSNDLRPRDFRHMANLDRAADYIQQQFASSGCRVSQQRYEAIDRTFRNVICSLGSSDSGQATLIVGAHYDAFSMTGNLPGADDNASGTAGVLELARLLARNQFQTPVELVAYSTEEPPFFASNQMGSAVHADSFLEQDRSIRAMICLEMIGYFQGDEHYDSPILGLFYPRKGDFIAVAGGWDDRVLARRVKSAMRGAGGVRVLSFTGPRSMGDASDQRSYWYRGFTAVMITDTAYLRNPNYHSAGDTANTLDYDRMARVVDGVANAVLDLDRDQASPRG